MSSGGEQAPNATKSGSDSELSSNSDYSSDDEKAMREDLNDLVDQGRSKLQRVSLNRDDDDESLSDMENDNSTNKGTKETFIRDNFEVDEEGRSVVYRKVRVAVPKNANPNLNINTIQEAGQIFSYVPPEAPKEAPIKVVVTEEEKKYTLDNDFERECDRGIYNTEVTESQVDWILSEKFSSRADNNDNDTEQYQNNKKALHQILQELRNGFTPQYIIKYKSDIFNDTDFGPQDVYTIQKSMKDYLIIQKKLLKIRKYESDVSNDVDEFNSLPEDTRESRIARLVKQIFEMTETEIKNGIIEAEDIEYDQSIKPLERIFDPTAAKLNNPEILSLLHVEDNPEKWVDAEFDDLIKYYQLQTDTRDTHATTSFWTDRTVFSHLTSEFLFSPFTFAVNLENHNTFDPPNPAVGPELALNYFHLYLKREVEPDLHRYRYGTVEQLEERMVEYAALELATNPPFLKYLRKEFAPRIVVNTEPTAKGMDSPLMAPAAKYGPIKRIKNKRIYSFEHQNTWLLIEEARKQGLITCKIDLDKGIAQEVEAIAKRYCVAYSSMWDDIRTKIITRAIEKIIWPKFVEETEADLLRKSSTFVCSEVESRLYNYLTRPPYTRRENGVLVSVPVVCMHVPTDESPKFWVACVSENGDITEHRAFSTSFFRGTIKNFHNLEEMIKNPEKNMTPNQKDGVAAAQWMRDFFEEHNPPVIAITASCLRSIDLMRCVNDLLNAYNFGDTKVIFCPVDAALIYANSDAADEEFNAMSTARKVIDRNVLIASSAARRMQNPMSELTRLVTPKRNHLVEWAMTPFQARFIGKSDERGPVHEAVERACLRAVAETGVDVNLIIRSYHHTSTLQFVPGLGPKTAAHIITSLKNNAGMNENMNKRELLFFHTDITASAHQFIKQNSGPFLRFPMAPDSDDRATSLAYMLDGTLIPPEYYAMTQSFFTVGIVERQNFDDSDLKEFFDDPTSPYRTEENIHAAIARFCSIKNFQWERGLVTFIASELLKGPYETLRFPTNEERYDEDISTTNCFNMQLTDKLATFHRCRREINRMPDNFYIAMNDREVFDALTISSSEPIKKNLLTEVSIFRVRDPFVTCRHSSGIDADAFDPGQASLSQLFPDGNFMRQYATAAIVDINYALLEISISFGKDDIERTNEFRYVDNNIDCFDYEGEYAARDEANRKAQNQVRTFDKRSIDHKDFRDITLQQAEAELSGSEVGAFIFRPSTQGNEHLSLTIRFPNNVYANFDIVERRKANPETIGEELWIRDTCFTSLEEIKFEFVFPMVDNLNNIMRHNKWVEDPDAANEILREEKAVNPKMIVYRLTTSMKHPGYLELHWMKYPDRPPVIEPIRLFGRNIFYRRVPYEDIQDVFNFFKKVGHAQPITAESTRIQNRLTESEEREQNRLRKIQEATARTYGRRK